MTKHDLNLIALMGPVCVRVYGLIAYLNLKFFASFLYFIIPNTNETITNPFDLKTQIQTKKINYYQ